MSLRPTALAATLATVGCASAALALAASSPAHSDAAARAASAPPTGALQMVLRTRSFHVVDSPPKRAHDGRPSAGDALITTYRVFDGSGTEHLGTAHVVCVAIDHRGVRQQCNGTITLPDGQLAIQAGDPDHVAVVGGSGVYAGARGTATTANERHDSATVTVQFLP
jgi:hypothetical protein